MDEDQVLKFNKSFTRSEPNLFSCKQVSVTEYYQQPGNDHPLIRHYSFRELHGNSECTQFKDNFFISPAPPFNLSHFRDNSLFKTPEKDIKPPVLSVVSSKYQEDEDHFEDTMKEHNYSPMDIDQSEDRIDVSMKDNNWLGKTLNIQPPKTNEENKTEGFPSDIKVIQATTKKESSSNRIPFLYVFLVLCMSLGIAFLFFTYNVSLSDISVTDIEEDLKLHLFNQNHIIEMLVSNLHKIHSSTDFKKLLILVGSTGVGKTHLLNRLQIKYPKDLVIILNYPLNKDAIEQTNVSLPNQCFILALDDLKMEHILSVESYIKSLSHKCILIIAIFNIQETSEGLNHVIRYTYFKEIAEFFNNKFTSSEAVLFNAMSRKHLDKWLKSLIQNRGIDLNKYKHFIQTLLESHDIDNYGFKGIVPKLNLIS